MFVVQFEFKFAEFEFDLNLFELVWKKRKELFWPSLPGPNGSPACFASLFPPFTAAQGPRVRVFSYPVTDWDSPESGRRSDAAPPVARTSRGDTAPI